MMYLNRVLLKYNCYTHTHAVACHIQIYGPRFDYLLLYFTPRLIIVAALILH